MTAIDFITEQNDPNKPAFTERERRMLDVLIRNERHVALTRDVLACINSSCCLPGDVHARISEVLKETGLT